MGVPVNRRKESQLDVIVKARELAVYTLEITQNPKKFPPQYWQALTIDLVTASKNVYKLCWTANNIRVTSPDHLAKRSELQTQAIMNCNDLLALMELAQKAFKFESKKLKYWSDQTVKCRGLIKAWRESDRKRYDKL